ncbi:translesion error-prone DNA polymerase V autoproteolytic subunit [Chitinibacter bivalviorum]|uniref:Translesion error-prone DNA polymerase V autoproteolytic subunit n=1 Tax=Chitinibacter bivalviorum TaxID=2739434 RepID=A0A7H9BHY1_9NEIS|nr:translesion error-prone DNA polymerase V autoproteolytic subunit [Chitinibacter bivalviorum]QLG88333.1 translesion error-prone DNA polymerase V autoproteolytic subunit [Chitinibacter bivalviorum]
MSSFLHGPFAAHQNPVLCYLPFVDVAVPAGFPSPASDWAEDRVDLNQRYVPHPEATFYFTVSGDSMIGPVSGRSIPDGATLIVDRAREAVHGDIVVAVIDGDFTVKRLYQRHGRLALMAENPAYPPLVLGDEQELLIWGVVTAWIARPQ